jgi:hypothetical protein
MDKELGCEGLRPSELFSFAVPFLDAKNRRLSPALLLGGLRLCSASSAVRYARPESDFVGLTLSSKLRKVSRVLQWMGDCPNFDCLLVYHGPRTKHWLRCSLALPNDFHSR